MGKLEATIDDLLRLWANPAWLAYLGCCVGGGAGLQALHDTYTRTTQQGQALPYSEVVLPMSFATSSALVGTFSVVLAKALSELLFLILEHGENIFFGPQWYSLTPPLLVRIHLGVWRCIRIIVA